MRVPTTGRNTRLQILDICSGGSGILSSTCFRDRLLSQYDAYPFGTHPYWLAVAAGTLLHPQVAAAEHQHVLQLRAAAECERHPYLGVAGEQAFALFLDQYLDALSATGAVDQLASIASAKAIISLDAGDECINRVTR